ncbi:MAG: hypothetical protein L0Z62_16570 [Gemmataceae bacterium]|nr:hypothetical protein [Gemmataceae bacterium]
MTSPLYKTTDPYLASFLKYQGAVMEGCTRIGPKKVEFRFVADHRLHDLLRVYWHRQPVPLIPSLLFDALRFLKSRSLTRP